MRRAEEERFWSELKKSRAAVAASQVSFGEITVDLSTPCLVVGGRNGAGKSRLLRAIATHLGESALFLDLHFLCEQALIISRSRTDFDDMASEYEAFGPGEPRKNDLERVIGREYEEVDWYAFEVEPSDAGTAARFRWGGEQALTPYFKVKHRGVDYASTEMGLGEYSIHLLFWILEQYRDVENLTLLLDEPDAYLPPIGASALLLRLLKVCLERHWNLVIATHASEIISEAVAADAFMLVRIDDSGTSVATHCSDDPTVAETLLARPPIRHVFFVEDESAWMLMRVLLERFDRRRIDSSAFVWGNGYGYILQLREYFPKPPRPDIHYAYVLDGDKRKDVAKSEHGRWPLIFLPTEGDPDGLYRSAKNRAVDLADRLHVPEGELRRFLDSREGVDSHDWVNDLGEKYERQRVLRVLAEIWVEEHPEDVALFHREIERVFRGSLADLRI